MDRPHLGYMPLDAWDAGTQCRIERKQQKPEEAQLEESRAKSIKLKVGRAGGTASSSGS